MPTRVKLPDGSFGQFPDGMADSDIESVIHKQFGPPQAAAPAPPGFGAGLEETLSQGAGKFSDIGAGLKEIFTHPITSAGLLADSIYEGQLRVPNHVNDAAPSPVITALKNKQYANAAGQVAGGVITGAIMGVMGGHGTAAQESASRGRPIPRTMSGLQGDLEGFTPKTGGPDLPGFNAPQFASELQMGRLKTQLEQRPAPTVPPPGAEGMVRDLATQDAARSAHTSSMAGLMGDMSRMAGQKTESQPYSATGPTVEQEQLRGAPTPPIQNSSSTAQRVLPIADNARAAFEIAVRSKRPVGGGIDPILAAAIGDTLPSGEKAPATNPMGAFKNFTDADAQGVAKVAVDNLKKGYPLSPEALKEVETKTGVSIEGKDTPKLIHDINNWRNASVLAQENARLNAQKQSVPSKPAEGEPLQATPTNPRTNAPTAGAAVGENPQAPGKPSSAQPQEPVAATPPSGTSKTPPTSEALIGQIKGAAIKAAVKIFPDVPEATHQAAFDAIHAAAKQSTSDPKVYLSRLTEAFKVYGKGLQKGQSDTAVLNALDAAKARAQSGFLGNRVRYTDTELAAQANLHVSAMLDQYEGMTNSELARGEIGTKLEDPIFMKQVGLAEAGSPGTKARWEAMNRRAWAARPDDVSEPIAALSRALGGGVTVTAKDIAGDTLNEVTGNLHRVRLQLQHQLQGEITRHDSYSIEDSNRFYQNMEEGHFAALNEADQRVAPVLRNIIDSRWEKIASMRDIDQENWISNYMPHLWANVGRARAYFSNVDVGNAFKAKAGFLKPRFYDMYNEGIAAGLEPVTYNPIKAVLLRAHEMDKYIAVHDALSKMEAAGTAGFVPYESRAPEGWVPLKADMLRGFKQMAEGQPPQAGRYHAPEPAAKVINNYLSPGLRGNVIYDTLATYNNAVNQANLGLSGFHAITTSVNAMLSDLALGIQKGFRGDVLGAAKHTTTSLSVVGSVAKTLFNGSKGLREYLEPGRYSELSRAVNALTDAGLRFDRPGDYRYNAMELFGKALKQYSASEGFGKAVPAAKMLYRGVGTFFEKTSGLLMNKFVPLMKAGVAIDMARDILENNPGAPPETISRLMNEAVDSVDNRMGEMIYDRVNMNKVVKDLAQISMRSFGWNFGTGRELGGAPIDTFKQGASLLKGNGARVTPRMAYAIALPVGVAYLNSLLQVALTGKPPQETLDYFFPHDKDGNRLSFKNYLTDAFEFSKHPVDTIFHKGSPIVGQAYALYSNKDYYGNQIYNPDAHPIDNLIRGQFGDAAKDAAENTVDLLKYAGKNALPFSLSNTLEMNQRGSGNISKAGTMIGLTPAPRWVGQSPAEEMAYHKMVDQMPVGARTPESAARYSYRMQLLKGLQSGKLAEKDIDQAIQENKISPKDADAIERAADEGLTPLERYTQRLSPSDSLQVWDKASPSEREKLLPQMYKKADSIERDYPTDQAEKLIDAYEKRVFK